MQRMAESSEAVICSLSALSSSILKRDAAPSSLSDDWAAALTVSLVGQQP